MLSVIGHDLEVCAVGGVPLKKEEKRKVETDALSTHFPFMSTEVFLHNDERDTRLNVRCIHKLCRLPLLRKDDESLKNKRDKNAVQQCPPEQVHTKNRTSETTAGKTKKWSEKTNGFLKAKNPQNVDTNDCELRDDEWRTKTHTRHPAR